MRKFLRAIVITIASPLYAVMYLLENHFHKFYRHKRTLLKEMCYDITNLWRETLDKEVIDYSAELRDYDLWTLIKKSGFDKDFLKLCHDEFPGTLSFLGDTARYERTHHKYEKYAIINNRDETYDMFYVRRGYNSTQIESNIYLQNISKEKVLKVLSKERGRNYD